MRRGRSWSVSGHSERFAKRFSKRNDAVQEEFNIQPKSSAGLRPDESGLSLGMTVEGAGSAERGQDAKPFNSLVGM